MRHCLSALLRKGLRTYVARLNVLRRFAKGPAKRPRLIVLSGSASNQNCYVHVWDRSDRSLVATGIHRVFMLAGPALFLA